MGQKFYTTIPSWHCDVWIADNGSCISSSVEFRVPENCPVSYVVANLLSHVNGLKLFNTPQQFRYKEPDFLTQDLSWMFKALENSMHERKFLFDIPQFCMTSTLTKNSVSYGWNIEVESQKVFAVIQPLLRNSNSLRIGSNVLTCLQCIFSWT